MTNEYILNAFLLRINQLVHLAETVRIARDDKLDKYLLHAFLLRMDQLGHLVGIVQREKKND
jgi:hypothetical protein